MITYAKDQNSSDRIDYFVTDIQKSKLIPDSWRKNFDLVFSFLCMQWVDDQLTALRNIHSLTKPGGEVLIALGIKPSAAFLRLMKEIKDHPRWKSYLEVRNKSVVKPFTGASYFITSAIVSYSACVLVHFGMTTTRAVTNKHILD
jgi:SAM-dependent methyltransferase